MLRWVLSEPALSSIQSCYFCVPLVILSDFSNNIMLSLVIYFVHYCRPRFSDRHSHCNHFQSNVSQYSHRLYPVLDKFFSVPRSSWCCGKTGSSSIVTTSICSALLVLLLMQTTLVCVELFSHPSLASVKIDSSSFTSFQPLLHCHNSDCILANSSNNI